jgi:hypothetical protein
MNTQHSDTIEHTLAQLHIHPASLTQQGDVVYGIDEAVLGQQQLAVLAPIGSAVLGEFAGDAQTIHN